MEQRIFAGTPYQGKLFGIARSVATMNFDGHDDGPTYAYKSTDEWADNSDCIVTVANDFFGGIDSPFANWERRAAEKATRACWSDPGEGRMLMDPSELILNDSRAAEALRPFLKVRGQRLVAAARALGAARLREIFLNAPIHLDRLHAGVLNTPGTDRESGLFELLQAFKNGTYLRAVDYAQQRSGRKNRGVILRRTQDSRTPQKHWEYVGAYPAFRGMQWKCKIRRVKAMDYIGNGPAAGFWETHKECYAAAEPVRHANDAESATADSMRWRFKLALDTPNFDDTVSYETLQLEFDLVLKPLIDVLVGMGVFSAEYGLSMEQHIKASWEYDFLAPARYKDEDACIWHVIGHVQSGFRGTTGLDMDIQWAAGELIKSLFLKRGVRVEIGNYGDDMRLLSNDPRVFTELRAVLAEFETLVGIALTLDPDDMYLQVSMGLAVPSFFRQLGRKQNRELKEQPLSDLHAALSLRASYERLRGMSWDCRPHPMLPHFFKTVEYCLPRYRIATELAKRLSLTELSTLAAGTVGVAAAWLDDFIADDRSGTSSFMLERDELAAALAEHEVTISPRTGLALKRDITMAQAMEVAAATPWPVIDAFYKDAVRKGRDHDDTLAQYGQRVERKMRNVLGVK